MIVKFAVTEGGARWQLATGTTLIAGWREQTMRPTFLVLSILKEGETAPYEAVLTVPAAMTQQQ